MGQYTAPLRDMQFVLHELLDVEGHLKEMPAHAEIDADTINQVIEEAGKFCSEVIFPLNQSGDREGCTYHGDGVVTAPKGFKEAYKQYVEGGWPALGCDPEYGGQGLPILINNAVYEMLNSANQAWTMYPGLSHGAYEALHAHGTDELKQRYLPKLVSGVWTGTMCLTEPHCGTDLGILRTKAEPLADGAYAITGTKIFISAGEHDLSENIIHLVLARLPDAPAAPRASRCSWCRSSFPMPPATRRAQRRKVRLHRAQDGHPRQRHLRDQPGWRARLDGRRAEQGPERHVRDDERRPPGGRHAGPGPDGSGLPELRRLRQGASADAQPLRPEGTGQAGRPHHRAPGRAPHAADPARLCRGGRAFAYWIALQIDRELSHPDEAQRKEAADLVALLTPVIKAFLTDNAFTATNEGMQVFGGHGYIAEWGMEQYVRDARINMIYEGTNTVQSLDLLGRKILGDMGAKMKKFGKIVQDFVEAEGTNEAMQEFINPLADIATRSRS